MAKTRSEVPVEETWRLEDIFPSPAAWEAALRALEADLPALTRYRGRVGESAATLLACLTDWEQFMVRAEPVASFASLRLAADGTSSDHQADYGKFMALAAAAGAETAFIQSELVQIPDQALGQYLEEEPGLAAYRPYLEEIRDFRPHALAPETERALAALGESLGVPYHIYRSVTVADLSFAPITDSAGQEHTMSLMGFFLHFEVSGDTALRRRAYESLVQGLRPYQNTLGAALATQIKTNVTMARLRGYPSTTHMLLWGDPNPQIMADHIPVQVYHNVLDVIQAELAPHMQRYARLRRQVLGLDRLLICDIKAPLEAEYDPQLTFDEGAELILGSVARLGADYTAIIRTAFRERWIDRADNAGRSGSAFCDPLYGIHPYVFSTWTGSLQSAFTLAHELGHAGHLYLTAQHQNLINARYSNFFVETPSTLSELLLAQHIRQTSADRRLHRWVIMRLLGTYHHNFVTHLLEGELLRRLYALAEAGEPITSATLCREKGDVLTRFWGDTVEIDAGARLTWMRQPHYYKGLYPYTYAAGLAAATLVLQMLEQEGEPAARRWLEVLKAGGSVRPLELFRMMGVDMSSPAPLRQAVAYVGALVDEMERSFAG